MFYGLAHYINKDGNRVDLIIRDIQASDRQTAEIKARRHCRNNGYIFDGIHLAANHRQKQGEVKQNYTLPRERAKALAAWRG